VVYTIAYASFTDLHLLAERVLSASLPAGFTAGLGDLVLKPISSPIEEQGMARWQMQAEQELHRYIDSEQVIFIALGKTVEKAEIMLAETYNLEDDPNISIRPNWWPWLPFLPFRIAVTG
jgi:hypothetical protein